MEKSTIKMPIAGMLWQHMSSYREVKRLLRNHFIRLCVLLLLALAFIYTLDITKSTKRISRPSTSKTQYLADEPINPLDLQSAVGKVHAVFGEPNDVYERALRLHETHSERNGHPMFVLRERLLSGLWSKPAFILSVMLQELAKPEDVRLKWLLWIDADIVVMNPQISLDMFIPPSPEFGYVNMLVTNDRHGLNNGCFLIRINPWAVKLLSGVIAFHNFKPEVQLKYSEQSALEEMIQDSYWRRAVVHVPQYWFNAYPATIQEDVTARPHEFRPGGLQIHFAGNRDGKRPDRMNTWMSIAEQGVPPYNMPVEQTGLEEDIKQFWAHLSEERTKKGIKPLTE